MATFNTTLQLDEPAEIVDARIAAALSKLTSSRARSQPGLIVITREYRPTWAVVLAIIGFFFFLLGLLFLLVKTTERLTISISSRGEEACTVVMAGEADDFVIVLLQSALATPTRECPNCKHPMKREASVCPSCRTESNPWIHHAGVWWVAGLKTGEWQWLDERAGVWRWYRDGTPSSPGVTDMTPNPQINPALVKPPRPALPSKMPTPSESPVTANELEQLAALHERGSLSDEEFQAAKARLLDL